MDGFNGFNGSIDFTDSMDGFNGSIDFTDSMDGFNGFNGFNGSIGFTDSTDSIDFITGSTGGVNADATDPIDATSLTATGEFACELPFTGDRTIGESPTDNSESLNTML